MKAFHQPRETFFSLPSANVTCAVLHETYRLLCHTCNQRISKSPFPTFQDREGEKARKREAGKPSRQSSDLLPYTGGKERGKLKEGKTERVKTVDTWEDAQEDYKQSLYITNPYKPSLRQLHFKNCTSARIAFCASDGCNEIMVPELLIENRA